MPRRPDLNGVPGAHHGVPIGRTFVAFDRHFLSQLDLGGHLLLLRMLVPRVRVQSSQVIRDVAVANLSLDRHIARHVSTLSNATLQLFPAV